MDVAIIIIAIAAWLVLAAAAAIVYGRIVARADHDNQMTSLHREQRVAGMSGDPAAVSTPRRS